MILRMSDSVTSPGENPNSRNRARSPWGWLLVDLRPEERGVCWALFSLHFLVLAFQYVCKSVRQSIFIDSMGAENLPFVYLLVAVVSYPVLRLYGRLVDRWPLRGVFVGTSLLVAASMVGFWWLFRGGGAWVSVAFYLWIALVGILLVSQFWLFASHCLDARQARRLFALVGAGGVLGSIAGGQIARWSVLHEPFAALWVAAALLVVQGVWMGWSAGRRTADLCVRPVVTEVSPAESLREARNGSSVVRSSPYLRLIAAVLLLSAMVAQVIDLQFSWVIEQNTQTLAERTATFGNLYSVMGVAALLFQLLFTGPIHRRLGVGFALRVLPTANGLGTVLFGLAAFFAPGFLLAAAWLLKISENGLRYSLDQASRELLFLPVPVQGRAKAKAFIDVFVQRLAKGLAAVALLAVTLGWMTVPQTVIFSAVWILLWLALVGRLRGLYVSAFRESLLRREMEMEDALELEDAATLEVLFEGLGSNDMREVTHSLDLLAAHGRGRLVPPLMLHHPEAEVRRRVLDILVAEGRRDATGLVEGLLVDHDPEVRAAATRALAVLGPHDVKQIMEQRLHDPDPGIRGAAVGYLAGIDDEVARRSADGALVEMLADGAAEVRLEAARALRGLCTAERFSGALVQLLYDGDERVVRGAIEAVSCRLERGNASPLYLPILVSHLRHRKLKHDARTALVAFGEAAIPALLHFMSDPQENIWVRRALPKTIARIGGETALRTLGSCLGAPDPFQRRKVIEALLKLRLASPGLHPLVPQVENQIAAECRGYLRALLDLESLRSAGGDGHLLGGLLADRMREHADNVFNLLALYHPPRDIRAAYRGLTSHRPGLRAHALEYLDNMLEGEVRSMVFAMIDDLPNDERQRRARKLFELAPSSALVTLRRLATAQPNGDADAVWLVAAALHYIVEREIYGLYPLVRQLAKWHAPEDRGLPLIRETTEMLLARMG